MKKLKTFLSLLGCGLIAVLNQNCGAQEAVTLDSLAASHSPSLLDIDQPIAQARLGDRVFIASVFADVFLPNGEAVSTSEAESLIGAEGLNIADYISSGFSAAEDGPIVEQIEIFILQNIDEFHGPCSHTEADASCDTTRNFLLREQEAEVQSFPPASVTREGYRVRVCNSILEKDRAVSNMVRNITGTSFAQMQEANIIDVYDMFYPAQEIEEEAYQALRDVFLAT